MRLVTTSGRTSLANTSDERGVMVAARSAGRIAREDGSFLVRRSSSRRASPSSRCTSPRHSRQSMRTESGSSTNRRASPSILPTRGARDTSSRSCGPCVPKRRPTAVRSIRKMLEICWPVLLRLDKDAPVPPLPIATKPAANGDRVSVIGFPVDTGMAATSEFAHHFTVGIGEKHVMPGMIERVAGTTWTFDHNCFTAPGTSGGPDRRSCRPGVVGCTSPAARRKRVQERHRDRDDEIQARRLRRIERDRTRVSAGVSINAHGRSTPTSTFVYKLLWCTACERLGVLDEVRLVDIVEVVRNVGEPIELAGLHQVQCLSKSQNPDVLVWRDSYRADEPSLEVAFRHMQTFE